MVKKTGTGSHRTSAVRERSQGSVGTGKRNISRSSVIRRVILFPTEPSTIGHKKIDEAIDKVIARRK